MIRKLEQLWNGSVAVLVTYFQAAWFAGTKSAVAGETPGVNFAVFSQG